MSGFGMEPMSVGKRLLERTVGNAGPERHARDLRPTGSCFAFGTDVAAGPPAARARSWTWCPPSSTSSACPSARDMDGFARTDIFAPAFSAGGRSHASDIRVGLGTRDSGLGTRDSAIRTACLGRFC
ncbi:MAG: hypothetical protein MZU84_04455 [Sphingobacterium sp.]|nr:hypothetical protein [Sphingobacterium sp.]